MTDSAPIPNTSASDFLDRELGELCRNQVRSDNQIFGIESAYLPNVILSTSPTVCLVSMEPSMGNVTVKQFEESVENGFRNFLKYEGDAVLHYCAYHYLCDRQFAYHITDISKGAMKVKMADCDREARYASWMPILKREIEELGEPIMIAIGNKASEALMHAGFQTAGRVRHFATRLDDWYRGYYLSYVRHTTQDLVSPFLDRWPGFVDKLMLQLPQHCLNISYLDKLRLSVSDAGRGRFLYYMDEFSQMIVGSVVNADKIGG